ncbi:MAG: hypothetical protein CMN76_18670 [Spirochaetaceae bacterium]|nr:hypothetical protein [Spirochaetaceae bacterium]
MRVLCEKSPGWFRAFFLARPESPLDRKPGPRSGTERQIAPAKAEGFVTLQEANSEPTADGYLTIASAVHRS